MGYTHYWYYHPTKGFSDEAWAKIVTDANALVEDAGCPPVKQEDDSDQPAVIDDTLIRFNGIGGHGHETFILLKQGGGLNCEADGRFECCKTAQKPYDKLVVAILAVAREHAPDIIRVSSDGDEEEWREGLEWASEVLGRPIKDPVQRTADAPTE